MNRILSLKTPCYLIDYDELNYNFNGLKSAFSHYWKGPLCIGYSVKTNHLKWVLEYMKEKGVYAEVVSDDEYHFAELIGYTPDQIIYNGPYKKTETLEYAIRNGSIVNIDSFSELERMALMDDIDGARVGLRVNFNLENECPGESAMGEEPSRFGFSLENGAFQEALKNCYDMNVEVCGLHMHQSTKTRSAKVFQTLAEKAAECVREYGLKDRLHYIDIGGGFFGGRNVVGKPTFEEYAKVICGALEGDIDMEKTILIIEPGASLISTPISYITRVIDVKDVRNYRIVTVDGSLLHINPFLVKREPSYTSYVQGKDYIERQIVCGSTCMENDRLLNVINSPEFKPGDTIEFQKCGSYTMSYNSCFINLPPAVYVKQDGKFEKVRADWRPEKLL